MNARDFTVTLTTSQPAHTVFEAIRNVRYWWSGFYSEEIAGDTEKLNDEFTFRAGSGAHFSRQRLIDVVPDKKVVWLVTESNLDFLENKDEWTNSTVIFEITEHGNQTQLQFTHAGLNPSIECYDSCAPAWTQYLQQRLAPLIQATKVEA